MRKTAIKVIQKDILGRLGRHFQTHAGIEEKYVNREIEISKNIYKESLLPGSVGPLDQTPQKMYGRKRDRTSNFKIFKDCATVLCMEGAWRNVWHSGDPGYYSLYWRKVLRL